MRFKSEKGITLTTLVITIIVILIVSSSMIYSGVNTYKSMIKQNFLAEMQVIQAEVNKFVDAYKQKAENLGLSSTDSFRRIYVTVYEDTTNGYTSMDAETRARYDEFYEFVNSYNSIEDALKEDLEEITFMDDVNSVTKRVLPRLNSDKAADLAIRETGKTSREEFREEMNNIWLGVFNTDGAQFVNLTDLDEAAKIAKIDQDQENYFYFTKEMASKFFNIEVSTDITVNFENGYVVSVSKNIETDDKIYYTEYNMQGGEKTVSYNASVVESYKAEHLDFGYNIEFEKSNKRFKITIIPDEKNTFATQNIYYYAGVQESDKTIDIGLNGQKVLSPGRAWNLVDGLSFYVSESNSYGVKLVDMNGNEAYREIKVAYINSPVLDGLTPVVKDGDSWRVSEDGETWYDYENGIWANAMIDDVAEIESNGTINKTGSMFVWIPRFAYRIVYFNDEADKTEYMNTKSVTKVAAYSDNRGLVKINGEALKYYEPNNNETFVGKGLAKNYIVEIKFLTGTTNNDTSGTDVTSAYGGYYRVHPAFHDDVDDKEISGFWVSKYNVTQKSFTKADGTGLNSLISTEDAGGTKNNLASLFMASYVMKNNFNIKEEKYTTSQIESIDTHMIKSTEYGAVVMLTAGLMEGKSFSSTSSSNINNDYGLFNMFDGERTYVAGITLGTWNIFVSDIRQYLSDYESNGDITRDEVVRMESNSKIYFDMYDSGSSTPDDIFGDAIYEFSYMDGTCFHVQFMQNGNTDPGTKYSDFILVRGKGSSAIESIAAATYETNVDSTSYTRVVMIAE